MVQLSVLCQMKWNNQSVCFLSAVHIYPSVSYFNPFPIKAIYLLGKTPTVAVTEQSKDRECVRGRELAFG